MSTVSATARPVRSPKAARRIAVSCRGLTKEFGSGADVVQALAGVELQTVTGELLILAGPSGCGKTTLISIMVGLLMPTAGACQVFGRDLRSFSSDELARWRGRHVGFVFQQFNLVPTLSARENVAIPLLIKGVARALALQKAERMLTRVGLAAKLQALPKTLSGGQQQRVAIARALVNGPSLLVCDEPTSSLDSESGQSIMRILRKIAFDTRRALVVVTHDSRVFKFADRIALMADGRIQKTIVQTSSIYTDIALTHPQHEAA